MPPPLMRRKKILSYAMNQWVITVAVCTCTWVLMLSACQADPAEADDPILVASLLPFSGEQAAVGLNMEQAISLAIADVNAAGGVAGRELKLVSRDSNSGSENGYAQARALLYDEKIRYLIGPEENTLAQKLVPDIKATNSLNILAGYAAPSVFETGANGAWIRLTPLAQNVGCAMGHRAIQDGHKTAVTIVSADDYQMQIATNFNTYFSSFGGVSLGSLVIKPGADSYLEQLEIIAAQGADVAVMLVYPPTAALLTEEWLIAGNQGDWYLSPSLNTDMFLQNVPFGALDGFNVFSPSLSLTRECVSLETTDTEVVDAVDTGESDSNGSNPANENWEVRCTRDNFTQFSAHYTKTWRQDHPLPASLYYYDAVVLLALGLQRAAARGDTNPTPDAIREHVRGVAESPGREIRWFQLQEGLAALRQGIDISYLGAAAEYRFATRNGINYGETIHKIIDTWTIKNKAFVHSGSEEARCMFYNPNDG